MCGHFISALFLFPFFLDFLFQVQNALFYDSYSFLVFFPGFPGRIVKPPVLFVSGLHGRAGYAAAHENDDVRRRDIPERLAPLRLFHVYAMQLFHPFDGARVRVILLFRTR